MALNARVFREFAPNLDAQNSRIFKLPDRSFRIFE